VQLIGSELFFSTVDATVIRREGEMGSSRKEQNVFIEREGRE